MCDVCPLLRHDCIRCKSIGCNFYQSSNHKWKKLIKIGNKNLLPRLEFGQTLVTTLFVLNLKNCKFYFVNCNFPATVRARRILVGMHFGLLLKWVQLSDNMLRLYSLSNVRDSMTWMKKNSLPPNGSVRFAFQGCAWSNTVHLFYQIFLSKWYASELGELATNAVKKMKYKFPLK